jgi:hypothetical protein
MSSNLSISTASKAGARRSSLESNAGKTGEAGKEGEAGKIGALFREAWFERCGFEWRCTLRATEDKNCEDE